jgi:hypothetical protein
MTILLWNPHEAQPHMAVLAALIEAVPIGGTSSFPYVENKMCLFSFTISWSCIVCPAIWQ